MSTVRLHVPIVKIDVQRHLVIGRLAQEVPDRAKEILDYETSKPYFKAWSEGFAKSTAAAGQEISHGNLRAMHGRVAAGKFTEVVCNDAEKAFDVIAKVVDAAEWEKCEEGVYTAFSIGGDYVGEKKAEKINGVTHMRYTANPGEGSLVDSPCIPTAKFFEIVKADGTSFQKAFASADKPEPTVAEQNAQVEKVAKRLARKEFWKLAPDARAQIPADLFEKMDAAGQKQELSKHQPDDNWQAFVLEAIRLIKSEAYDEGDDLEKPDEIDQEEWDAMSYDEKMEALDEFELSSKAKMKKADDEKGFVKPTSVEQEEWDSMTTEGKRKAIAEANDAAQKAAKAAALEKTQAEELAKGGAGGKVEADLEKPADVAQDDWDAMDGVKRRAAVEAAAARAAKAAGATDAMLSAVDQLAKMLDSGKVTPEALLEVAKREFSPEQRDKAADSGAALPDGSFPIKTVSDLENAVQAYGRAKNKEAAKAHIIARARALGATDKLPEDWTKKATSPVQKDVDNSDVKKDLYNVQNFARALQALAGICASAQGDLEREGDASPIPEQLRDWINSGTKIFCDMAEEEADELVEQLSAYKMPGSTSPVEEAMALQALATMHKVDGLRKQLEDTEISLVNFHKIAVAAVGEEAWKTGGFFQKYVEDRAACIDDILAKAGARHSAADKEHLQQAHDHLCKLGASCNEDNLSKEATEKITGNGAIFKLALQSSEQITKLENALSETQRDLKKLRDEPVRPKGVVRSIAKGQDSAETAADAAARAAAADAAAKAAQTPQLGVHNEAAAIAAVREQVVKTAAFRNLG